MRVKAHRLTPWHRVTIALLALGYSGHYFCRSDLAVVLPDLIHDLALHGITPSQAQVRLGFIASAGTVAYALGKFIFGAVADMLGGSRNFIAGMVGSIFFTILFALSGGLPLFTLAWICNLSFSLPGGEGLLALVLIHNLRNCDGRFESELPVRGCRLPMDYEPAY